MTNLLEIGKHVRKKRKELKLSLKELAELTGFSYTYLGYIERGEKTNINRDVIVKLCEVLQLSPLLFFPEFQVEKVNFEPLQRMEHMNLTAEEVHKVLDLIEYFRSKQIKS